MTTGDRSTPRKPCDIYRVARQCGVRLHDSADNRTSGRKAGDCYCKPTLRRIGQEHGEAHLALCLRLINETGNGTQLHAATITAVSILLETEAIEVDSHLFDRFDRIDLGRLRQVCRALPGAVAQTMAAMLLGLLHGTSVFERKAAA